MAQMGLNRYWEERWQGTLSDARVGIGEVVFVVIGVIFWLGILVPPSFYE
jgi:hypothetical protein